MIIDLCERPRLSDNDFDAWLEQIGLLHGKRTCAACGGRTTMHVCKVGDTGHGDAPLKIAEKNGAICVALFLKVFIFQFTRYP